MDKVMTQDIDLQMLRDQLIGDGMSATDAAYVCSSLWTDAQQPEIKSRDEYERLKSLATEMGKTIPLDKSAASVRLTAMWTALVRYDEEEENGL